MTNQIFSSSDTQAIQNPLYDWDTQSKKIYKINIKDKKNTYEPLKESLIKACNSFRESHPKFTPRITFSDNDASIKIGHSYREFYFLIPEAYQHLFPPPETLKFQPPSAATGWEVSLAKRQDIEVFALVEGHRLLSKTGNNLLLEAFPVDQEPATLEKSDFPKAALPKGIKKDNFIQSLSSQNKPLRLVLGEQHSNTSARDMLISAMPDLAKKGAVLAVEGLYFESHQTLLDQWIFNAPDTDTLPFELTKAGARTGLQPLLIAAKKHKVRVLAIDTESLTGTADLVRARGVNNLAKQIIDDVVGQGDFVALVGAGHAADYTLLIENESIKVHGLGSTLKDSTCALVLNSQDLKGLGTHKDVLIYNTEGSQVGRLHDVTVLSADPNNQIATSNHRYKIENTVEKETGPKIHHSIKQTVSESHVFPKVLRKPAGERFSESDAGSDSAYGSHLFFKIPRQFSSGIYSELETGKGLISGSSSSSSLKIPDSWDKEFRTTYRIQIDENITPITSQNITGEVVLKTYEDLKNHLIQACAELSATDPTFIPYIRFNDLQKTIEIGHTYTNFRHDISATIFQNLPDLSELIIAAPDEPLGSKGAIKILAPDSDHQLKSSKNGSIFGHSPTHEDFNAEVETYKKTPPNPYLIKLSEKVEKNNLIKTLIEQAKKENKPFRLILGEQHSNPTARDMVMDAMPHLKGKTLAIEGLFYNSQQHILDQWMKANQGPNFPFELKDLRPDVKEFLSSAKKHGVRILAIDSEILHPMNGDRIDKMNHLAKQIILKEVGKGDFIALVGAQHAADYQIKTPSSSSEQTISPGLRSLLDNTLSAIVLECAGQGKDVVVNSTASVELQSAQDIGSGKSDPSTRVLVLESDLFVRTPKPKSDPTNWFKIEQKKIHPPLQRVSSILDVNGEHANPEDSPNSTQKIIEQDLENQKKTSEDATKSDLEIATGQGSRNQKKITTATLTNVSSKDLNKGMTILGMAGGINALYRGNIVDGVVSISESTSDIIDIGAQAISNNKTLTKIAQTSSKAASALKTANTLGKVTPWIGAGFSAVAIGQDSYDLGKSLKEKDGLGVIQAATNLLLDTGLLICSFIPGAGTVVAIGLAGSRLFSSSIFDQAVDPKAYEKTWAILHNGEANWFEKGLSGAVGAVQFAWAKGTILGRLTAAIHDSKRGTRMPQLSELEEASPGTFVTVSEQENSYEIDFTRGTFSNHGGSLKAKIKNNEITFELDSMEKRTLYRRNSMIKKTISHTITLKDTPEKTILIRMGQGVTYDYLINEKSVIKAPQPKRSLSEVTLVESSLTSYYDAKDATANVTFVAPSRTPTTLQDSVTSHALGKDHNSFHYIMSGGQGENTYMLGKQNATIICGSGTNVVQLPFHGTPSRTIVLKNFRDDGSCTLTLTDIQTSSDLFQNAKISMHDGLHLQIGETMIKVQETITLKKLFIRTEDTILALDVSSLSANTNEYSLKDTINSTYMGYRNLWTKDAMQYLKNLNDPDSISKFLGEIMEKTTQYTGVKGENFYNELNILAEYIEKEKNYILEQKEKITEDHVITPCDIKYAENFIKFKLKKAPMPIDDCITIEKYESLKKESNQKIKSKSIDFLSKNFKSENIYFGTKGEDIFVLNQKECGYFEIKDFDDEKDRLKIVGINTEADVQVLLSDKKKVREKDKDVFIEFDAYNSITLKNINISTLTADDFFLESI